MYRELETQSAKGSPSSDSGVFQGASGWDGGLQGFVRELESRLPGSAGHARRVASLCRMTSERLRLGPAEILRIERAALVHDIGKLIVSPSILRKPGPLTTFEYEAVKRHSAFGAKLVVALGDPGLTAIVRHHHERIDGSGYPDGLRDEEIPLGARIVAVADTFDALTSRRPYREPCSVAGAFEVIEIEAGATFDPDVVTAFLG